MTDETNLVLGSLVIPIGAGRGITQTIDLVDNGDLRRTVNGTLIDLTRDENRKYTSKISATDQKTPSLAGLWKGQQLVVSSIATIRQLVNPAASVATLVRTPVTGSVYGRDINGDKITPTSVIGLVATFPSNIVMVEFYPKLTMLISDITTSSDEYASSQTWDISLEEV
jgi:hypothetical protein